MPPYYLLRAPQDKQIVECRDTTPGPRLPPAFYKFFPPPDAQVHLRPKYQRLCCPRCGRYDADKAFELGFDEPVTIRFKEDMGLSDDRIFVVNDKCVRVLKSADVAGFETKPIGKSGWHALRAILLVDSERGLLKPTKPNCPECGRPKSAGAWIWRLNQLSPPARANTFFSTKMGSAALPFKDRDIFITEDVLDLLRMAKIRGPHCERMWTDTELKQKEQEEKKGKNWRPPGMTVQLKGK